MNRAGLVLAGALTALSACAMPEREQTPAAQFTPQEKADIILTAQFLQCTNVNIERIQAVHPNDKDYVMEFCANMTGFTLDTFGNVMDQMSEKYGDDWPDMMESMSADLSLQDYEPPLIPNDLFGIGFD